MDMLKWWCRSCEQLCQFSLLAVTSISFIRIKIYSFKSWNCQVFRRYIMNFSIQYEVICKDFYDTVTFLHCFLWAAQQPENINTNVLKEVLILSRYIHSTEIPFCRHSRFPSVLKSVISMCFLNKEIETFLPKEQSARILLLLLKTNKQTKTLG